MIGPAFSGAKVVFGEKVVSKTASGEAGARLADQFARLRSFKTTVPKVGVPHVGLFAPIHDDETQLFLERIEGPGLAINCDKWAAHARALLSFLESEFLGSATILDVGELLRSKLESIVLRCPIDNGVLHALEELLDGVRASIGPCHGDLTLCNVLCSCKRSGEGSIALIDMIASPVESPLQDLAKLRQDVEHGWLELHVPEVDASRVSSFAATLNDAFPPDRNEIAFRALSILRILPYATSDRVVSWIHKELKRCLEKSCF